MVDRADSHGFENTTQTLALLTKSGSPIFDLIIMVKDGIEQSGLRGKRKQFRSLSIRTPLNWQEPKRGWNRRRKGGAVVNLFQFTHQGNRRGIGRSDTQENTNEKTNAQFHL